MRYQKYFLIIFSFILFFIFTAQVKAATLYLLPKAKTFGMGQEFSVDIKIDTEDVSINAAQAIINFPNNVLELLSANKEGSTFNFWVEEPTISNENGALNFISGTAKGVSGESLQVLRMRFKTIGVGSEDITISNAVVTASDGKGTNVLSTVEGASISVGTQVIAPEPAPAPAPADEPVKQPERVIRTPIPAKELPAKPELRAPLYPDESRWYSHLGEVIVFWDLPLDVIQIATRLSQSRDKKPGDNEAELFTGKSFGVLEEGIWYIRVQFRNNIGWSESAYYKISIDTTAPIPFEIEIDNQVTDNPTPEIRYESQDSLSGLSHTFIFVDGQDPITTTTTIALLPPQPPGQHTLMVRVFDLAGNSVEDDLEFEILPLPLPIIDFITKSVSQGEFIFVSGKAIPNGFVDLQINNKSGQEVFRTVAESDGLGNWESIIEEPLAKGKYTLSAVARDERGALSYSTEAEAIKIKAKTILSIGLIDLSWFEIVLIVLLLVVSGTSVGTWYYTSTKKRRAAYKTITGRDIDKLTTLLTEDLKGLEDWVRESKDGFEKRAKPEMEFRLKSLRDTVEKMKKYLRQELDKLR